MSTIEDGNLFMMCKSLNREALTEVPDGYFIRNCRREEYDIWLEFPFDNEEDRKKYKPYMDTYFKDVYSHNEEDFWNRCLFICNQQNVPVGTCFAWKSYGSITTIHWFKVRKECEGKGIGRGLLSYVMKSIKDADFPVYLHTQPGSFRAIKIYSDFGFELITDDEVGYRKNDLWMALPFLKERMPSQSYNSLKFTRAPQTFLSAVKSSPVNQF